MDIVPSNHVSARRLLRRSRSTYAGEADRIAACLLKRFNLAFVLFGEGIVEVFFPCPQRIWGTHSEGKVILFVLR